MLLQTEARVKVIAAELYSCLQNFKPGEKIRFSELVVSAFCDAFESNGLDGVDELIDSVNKELKSCASKIGFRQGSALEAAAGDRPAKLYLCLIESESDQVFSHEFIQLR